MKIELTGKVYRVGDTEEVGTNKFQKREIILLIDEDEEYPQHIAVVAVGGKVSIFDDINDGDIVEIKGSLNGRLYQGVNKPETAINQINCWKIDVLEEAPVRYTPAVQEKTEVKASKNNKAPSKTTPAYDDDDLPF